MSKTIFKSYNFYSLRVRTLKQFKKLIDPFMMWMWKFSFANKGCLLFYQFDPHKKILI